MSCQSSEERQARYLNSLEARMRTLERSAVLLQQMGDCSNYLTVWSPDALFRHDEFVDDDIEDQWIATVPRPFEAQALRLSWGYNPGKDLNLTINIGAEGLKLAEIIWDFAENVDSLLVPFADWGSDLTSNVIPAGARMTFSTGATGGPAPMGLKLDFLGRWKQ